MNDPGLVLYKTYSSPDLTPAGWMDGITVQPSLQLFVLRRPVDVC